MQDEKGKTEFASVRESMVRRLGPGLITENLDAEFEKAKDVNLPLVPPGANPEQAVRTAMRKRGAYGYSVNLGGMKRSAANYESNRVYDVPYNPFRQRLTVETPRNVTELNARYRYYMKYEPLVGAAIELHTQYPLSQFNVDHEDQEISDFFNSMMERLDMLNFLTQMVNEYWTVGEAFPYGFLDDPYDPTEWDRFILLNPDNVVLESHPMILGERNYNIFLTPDAAITKIIENGPGDEKTGSLYKQIPLDVIEAVKTKKPMQLNDLQVSHFKRSGDPFNLRGESLLSRILHLMAYRDKLREAQYVLCDRHVTPREFYFLGDKDQPADDEEIQNFAELLAATYMDPNQAIVWHHAVNPQVVGTADKVLPLRQEFTQIEEEMLTALMISKAFTHSEGPCVSSDTETLTRSGFKYYEDIKDGEEIATYNPETGKLEYHVPTGRVKFDIDGEMVHFENQWMDHKVSTNHRCWVQNKDGGLWHIRRADEVAVGQRLANILDWDGEYVDSVTIESKGMHAREDAAYKIPINDYVRFLGYYLAEGYLGSWKLNHRYTKRKARNVPDVEDKCVYSVVLSQAVNEDFSLSEKAGRLDTAVRSLPFSCGVHKRIGAPGHKNSLSWTITKRALAQHLLKECGYKSLGKHIPTWVKNLPKEQLRILWDALLDGDGSTYASEGKTKQYEYYTVSKQLADDVQEICMKLGWFAKVVKRPNTGKKCQGSCKYKVVIVPTDIKERSGYSRNPTIKEQDLKRVPYKGYIYCFEVPNHLFVVRRNGKVVITGNTYANASVALDVLISKYITLRNHIEQWMMTNVFGPMCVIHDLYKPTQAEVSHRIRTRRNNKPLWLPKIKWVKNDLRNNEQKVKLLQGLMEKGLYPKQKFFHALDEDYDEIKRLLREEKAEALAEKAADKLAAPPTPKDIGGGEDMDLSPPDAGGGGPPEPPEAPDVPDMGGPEAAGVPDIGAAAGPNIPVAQAPEPPATGAGEETA